MSAEPVPVKRVEEPQETRKRPAGCDVDREQDAATASEDLPSAEERRRDAYRVR
jgi:hypothetical protein